MNKNNIIGYVLIAAILMGWFYLTAPSAEERARSEQKKERFNDSIAELIANQEIERESLNKIDSIKEVETAEAMAHALENSFFKDSMNTQEALRKKKVLGTFWKAAEVKTQEHIIENDLVKLFLSNESGRISRVELKNYKQYHDSTANVVLLDADSSFFNLKYVSPDGLHKTIDNQYKFEAQSNGFYVHQGEEAQSFKYRLYDENRSGYIEYVYTLKSDEYMMDYSINIRGLDNEINPSTVNVYWNVNAPTNEKTKHGEDMQGSVFYKYNEESKRDYLSESGNDELKLEQTTKWVCFKEFFFSALIMSETGFKAENSSIAVTKLNSPNYYKNFEADLNLGMKSSSNGIANLQFYFGPNDYDELNKYGEDMPRIINLGWGIIGWVNRGLIRPVFNFFSNSGMSVGIAILLMTFFVKLLLFPLTYKNYKSSAKMRILRPEIDEINKKFPDKKDAMKKQQATMSLWKSTGVSPLSGCIPMLFQMPILYAMFRFFPSAIELRGKAFLWAEDLSTYDSIYTFTGGFEIPLYGDHISLFTILMAITTGAYTLMNSSNMPTQEGMPNMKVMMYIFPFMMLFFFNNFASGLSYYYFISSLTTMGQMWAIKKFFVNEDALRLQMDERKKAPKKKSKFAARMEEMQRIQRERNKKK